MNNNNHYSSGGMSLVGVLTVIFVVLKLVGVISWGWVWVLSPLWISLGLWVVITLFLAALALLWAVLVKESTR